MNVSSAIFPAGRLGRWSCSDQREEENKGRVEVECGIFNSQYLISLSVAISTFRKMEQSPTPIVSLCQVTGLSSRLTLCLSVSDTPVSLCVCLCIFMYVVVFV